MTDITALLALAQLGVDEYGVPLGDGGLHAGEWETSMLEAIHPELVHPERAEVGYNGDPEAAIAAIFGHGVHTISSNGVIGDPSARQRRARSRVLGQGARDRTRRDRAGIDWSADRA